MFQSISIAVADLISTSHLGVLKQSKTERNPAFRFARKPASLKRSSQSWIGMATVRRVSADASSAEKYNYEESAHVQDYVESHVRGV